MDLSIVISLYNENESLRELVEWIDRAIAQSPIAGIEYEILMIDDGMGHHKGTLGHQSAYKGLQLPPQLRQVRRPADRIPGGCRRRDHHYGRGPAGQS